MIPRDPLHIGASQSGPHLWACPIQIHSDVPVVGVSLSYISSYIPIRSQLILTAVLSYFFHIMALKTPWMAAVI